MKEKLLNYFTNIMPLSKEEIQAIEDSMCVQTYPKGTFLLREGQLSQECYFVLKGCIRQYSLTGDEEKTHNFFTEEQWIVPSSFIQQIPSSHFFVCSEESVLVVGNEVKENELYRMFPRFETISRKVMEKVFAEQQEQMTSYHTDSPEQRYLKLLKLRPDLFQRIPQYQLASYIGVKPESLSRIRKRIV